MSIVNNNSMKIYNWIEFFKIDMSTQLIYAHKQYYIDKRTNTRKIRIKSEEEIFEILKEESLLLKHYMHHTYNINIPISSKGYITQFPFKDRWLRGEEYGFLNRHYYAYSHYLKMFKVID